MPLLGHPHGIRVDREPPDRQRTLLTHHRKLGKWLQLGGHADGDPDLLAVALREAREESGLSGLTALDTRLFDVDRHWIGSRGHEPGHWHHDFRFIIEADPAEALTLSQESKALSWVDIGAVTGAEPRGVHGPHGAKDAAAAAGLAGRRAPEVDRLVPGHPSRLPVGKRDADPAEKRLVRDRRASRG